MGPTCFSDLYFLLGVVATMTVGGIVVMVPLARDVSQRAKRILARHSAHE